jgi:tRNA nucleotidyltransferase (CCA-adding enzyme)
MEVITTHTNADFDAMASMLAAKKLYPDAVVAFSGSQEQGLRDFFVQSTFYAFDFAKIKDVDFDQVTRLILVDIREPSRIGPFKKLLEKKGLEIHIFDHHPFSDGDIRGDVEHIAEVGAAVTILTEILKEQRIAITPDEATIMMLGIYEDTGSLAFGSTTTRDYQAAAFLLEAGANLNIVSDMLTRELTVEQVELLGEMIQNREVHNVNGIDVTIIVVTNETYVGDVAVLVHKIIDMENLDALFVLALLGDRTYLVARSRIDEVDAGEVALAFGGGGHATAASASIKGMTLVEAQEKLMDVLDEVIRPIRTAQDIMSFPVKSVEEDVSLKEAGELLSRYNVNVLAVVDTNNRLTGTISRQIIERGVFHGMKAQLVREFMNTDVGTVTPDATVRDIQRKIIDRNQRFLPVVEDGILVGAITRTDLLRALYYGAAPRDDVDEGQEDTLITGNAFTRTKSVVKLMEERLSREIMTILEDMGAAADELGYNAYAVGGFVRDLWLRRENFDVDVVIEGDGIAFARHLEEKHGVKIRVHKKFGTAVVIYPDGFKVDVATARTEYYEYPGALPIIEGSTLKLDLYRRDFTINTLAVKITPRGFGTLIDFFGAIRDLKDKVIRVIQNLSFVEDPTRIFRAVRFEQRFSFQIGKQTQKLIRNAVKINVFDRLAAKRLYSELMLIFEEEHPYRIIQRLNSFDLLSVIHPTLRADKEMEELFQSIDDVVSWYDLLFLDERYRIRRIYLYALLNKLSTKARHEILSRLEVPRREHRAIMDELENMKSSVYQLATIKSPKQSEIYTNLIDLRLEALLFMMAVTTKKTTKQHLSTFISRLRTTTVRLRGKDLLELGFKPGNKIGEMLDDLLMKTLDGQVYDRESELKYIRETYLEQDPPTHRIVSP